MYFRTHLKEDTCNGYNIVEIFIHYMLYAEIYNGHLESIMLRGPLITE